MGIAGIDGLSPEQLRDELRRGGRFVVYGYCVSVLVLTFRRSSDVTFVRAEESAVVKGLGWTALSLVAGWWGIPWGFLYTPMVLAQNLGGGKDVTAEVVRALGLEVSGVPAAAIAPSDAVGEVPGRYAPGGVPARFEASVPPSPNDPGPPAPPPHARPLNPDAARAADQLGGWALGTSVPGLCCFPLGLAAIVLGVLGLNKAKAAGRPVPATAVIGLVLGGLGLLLQVGSFAVGKLAPSWADVDAGVAPKLARPTRGLGTKAPAATPTPAPSSFIAPPATPVTSPVPTAAEQQPELAKRDGRLELDVTQVYPAQKPLDVPPFHVKGGAWTYLEVSPRGDPSAKALVGLRSATGEEDESAAVVVAADAKAGARFLDAVGAAFGVEVPKPRANPTKLAPLPIEVEAVAKSEGGHPGDEKGAWISTRWSLSRRNARGEALFDFSLTGRQAELRSAGDGDELMALLAEALRDGPPPPRSPANDPTLAKDGPRFVGLVKVSSDDRSWVDGNAVYFVTEASGGEVLWRFDSEARRSTEVSRFEGRVVELEAAGRQVLVIEALGASDEARSTSDPRRAWVLDGRTKRRVGASALGNQPALMMRSLSPDGRWAAFGRWESSATGGGHREVVVLNLVDGLVQRLARGDSSFDVVDWEQRASGWVLHVQRGLVIEEETEQAAFDYELATKTLVKVARPLTTGEEVVTTSPDGKMRVSAADGKVTLTELATGKARVMTMHQDDARFAEDGAFNWVSPRYLAFEPGGRPALVDAKALTVWFPLPEGEQPILRYTVDFKTVVKADDDGLFIGRVVSP